MQRLKIIDRIENLPNSDCSEKNTKTSYKQLRTGNNNIDKCKNFIKTSSSNKKKYIHSYKDRNCTILIYY